MTKTELKLIEKALEHGGRYCVTTGYRTGRKNGGYGGRECSALGKLVRSGLVKIVSQTANLDCQDRYSDHWTETVFVLSPGFAK